MSGVPGKVVYTMHGFKLPDWAPSVQLSDFSVAVGIWNTSLEVRNSYKRTIISFVFLDVF